MSFLRKLLSRLTTAVAPATNVDKVESVSVVVEPTPVEAEATVAPVEDVVVAALKKPSAKKPAAKKEATTDSAKKPKAPRKPKLNVAK